MPRGKQAPKRIVMPDPMYQSELLGKFINTLMERGKKSTAERIMYDAMDLVTQKVENANAVSIIEKALANARPLLQLKSRRVGGATYQIPCEVREDKGITIVMRWIRDAARTRKGRSMQERLAEELKDAYNGQGTAVKKRDEVHKMAEANRAFSHYRF